MKTLILVILGLVAGPLLGGLIAGLDRRVTAWFQSRQGPPIVQPFYDVAKLFGKERMVVNRWQILCAWVYLIAAATALALFFAQGDLLIIFFVQAVGAVFLVMGAMSARSPYSQVGAQRELLQVLAYEPVLLLVFVGFYLVTGSFSVGAVWQLDQPLLARMPLLYLALGYALTIKLRKSPFDFSAAQHAHQELVRGLLTEFSGPYLGLVEMAHWYETVLLLSLCAMFWSTNVFWMIVLVACTYLLEILVDNTMARMTWRWMLKRVWLLGMGMSIVNLIWLYAG